MLSLNSSRFFPPWQVPYSSWLGLLLGLSCPFHMDHVEALVNLAVNFVLVIKLP
jgi:hypothetical protein